MTESTASLNKSVNYVHLRVHSDFSMMDGLNKVKPLLERAQSLDMPAIAITDQMNMCGLVKFYSEAHNRGIKPIIGSVIPFRKFMLKTKFPG